jgi:ATP-dependent DNA helicase DinG
LPASFSDWRSGQFEAIQQSKASKKRIVGQAAPTGVGKSLILMGEALMTEGRNLILTSTKPLQDQYVEKFPQNSLTDLRGQQNYLCLALQSGGEHYAPYIPLGATVDEGPCHFGQGCSLLLGGCLYYDRLRRAGQALSVITNYDLALAIAKYSEGIGLFNFVACDEAHEIPEKLASSMAAEVTCEQAKNLLSTELFPSTNPLIWASWASRQRARIVREVEGIKEAGQVGHPESRYRLKHLLQLQHTLTQMSEAEEDWIVDIGEKKVRLEPLWPRKFAEPYLFNGAKKIVLSSATIRPKTFDLLGVEEFDFFEYPSPFDVARRPVYYVPTVSMRYDMEQADKLRMVRAVDQIIARRLDRKIIIPIPSFALQKFLVANSKFGRYMVTNRGSVDGARSDTERVIKEFKAAPAPAILVSPSISTGVDFPYTECETIIIIKVPFPDISSSVYRARSADDRAYGPYIAIQTLVQMAGRGMRAPDDRCETIVLDQTLGGLLSQYRDLFPSWFLTAIRKSDTLPQPLDKL